MRFCYCSTLLHWNFFWPPRLPLRLSHLASAQLSGNHCRGVCDRMFFAQVRQEVVSQSVQWWSDSFIGSQSDVVG